MAEAIARSTSIRPDSIINDVVVIVAPNPVQPTPTDQQTISVESQTNYGVQSIVIQNSPLASDADAALLADYLIRADPNFWYTGLSINMHALTPTERTSVSTLDIGDFVAVVKTFKFGTPPIVQKNLFVEGIDHRITTTTHHIDLYFSPVGFSQPWNNVTPTLTWGDVPSGVTWSNLIWTIL
jgi:hypothetical protein